MKDERHEPRRKPPPRHPRGERKTSLVVLNTGHGKGKSTAAFGIMVRALAREWPVCVVQFIKSGRWKVGEEQLGRRLGVAWLTGGDGFSWLSTDLEQSRAKAVDAWAQARAAITSDSYRLVILDELTYPVNWGWIELDEVVTAIRDRPARVNVVITGRDAPPALLEVADTATEMVKLRHAYDRGVSARRGIDF